jgi:hypothetical protein
VVVGVLAAVVALALGRRKGTSGSDDEDDSGGTVPNKKKPYLKPIKVGEAADPEVAPYMALLQARFISALVHPAIKVFDLVVMTKAPITDGPDEDDDPTRPVAIPPLAYWDNFVNVAVLHTNVITSQGLDPTKMRFTGYRAEDYNAAVGGASDSAHIWAGAIDAWAKGGSGYSEKLKMGYARYFVKNPKKPIGFGAYTSDVHFDLAGRRTWKRGLEYAEKAKKEGIA